MPIVHAAARALATLLHWLATASWTLAAIALVLVLAGVAGLFFLSGEPSAVWSAVTERTAMLLLICTAFGWGARLCARALVDDA